MGRDGKVLRGGYGYGNRCKGFWVGIIDMKV